MLRCPFCYTTFSGDWRQSRFWWHVRLTHRMSVERASGEAFNAAQDEHRATVAGVPVGRVLFPEAGPN